MTILAADFGASPSASAHDNTVAINAAIAAASGGETVRLPAGSLATETINLANGVSLEGEGSAATTLVCSSGTAINATNVWMAGITIAGLRLQGVAGSTTGLYVGSSIEGTAHARIVDVTFINHLRGLDGGGNYALFDSLIESCHFHNCTGFGLAALGSQITSVNNRFAVCGWGVKIGKLNGNSIGGVIDQGSIFIGNNFDIVTVGGEVRKTVWNGTWFEQNTTSILGTTYSNAQKLDMSFNNATMQPASSAAGDGVTNIPSFVGVLSFDGCKINTGLKSSATLPGTGWTAPVSGQSRYSRQNCWLEGASPYTALANI